MASALQRGSFELCGEEADGAISWICPGIYLRDVALPAMQLGAERAGRPVPPLIAHALCVCTTMPKRCGSRARADSESEAALLPPDADRCWLSRGNGWHLE